MITSYGASDTPRPYGVSYRNSSNCFCSAHGLPLRHLVTRTQRPLTRSVIVSSLVDSPTQRLTEPLTRPLTEKTCRPHERRYMSDIHASDLAPIMRRIDSIDPSQLTTEAIRDLLTGLSQVSAWVETQKLCLTKRLQQLASKSPSVVPAEVLASSLGVTRTDAKRGVARVETLSLVPQLGSALSSGNVSVAHVDAVTQAMAHLSLNEKKKVATRGEWMNMVATHASPENLARAVRHAVQQLHTDAGLTQLEQQRKRMYLRHWVDRDTGMVCLRGEFDPETGLHIVGRLQNAVERLMRQGNKAVDVDGNGNGNGTGTGTGKRATSGTNKLNSRPDIQAQSPDHLRALGLHALITNVDPDSAAPITSAYMRAEVSVVIDLKTLQSGIHRQSIIHTGTDVDLPIETIRRIACEAKIIPVVLGGDGVVLDLGRSNRLASRHQRRALESMHKTCAIPDCQIPVAQCQPHHINFWHLGGPTDMDNLVPLCAQHHRLVHEGGWKLTLDSIGRKLHIREPGGRRVRTSIPESVRLRQ